MSWSEFWSFITPEWLAFPLVGHYLSADLTWWQWGVIAFDMLLRIVALGYVPPSANPPVRWPGCLPSSSSRWSASSCSC